MVATTSPKLKAPKTALDPVWSFLLSDYSDSDHDEEEEEDAEYPPRKKRVHWGRLPTRFDVSEDEDEEETRDDEDEESNYLYMVPKYSASAASAVLQSLLSFSDNEHEDDVDDEEEDEDEVRPSEGNLLGRLFARSGARDSRSVAVESREAAVSSDSPGESKILSYLFPARDANSDSADQRSKPGELSFLKSLFSSDDESRSGEGRQKTNEVDEASRDGIASRFSIWSWTSDEEDDDDDEIEEDDAKMVKDVKQPVPQVKPNKRRFLSRKQRRMLLRSAKNKNISSERKVEKGTESASPCKTGTAEPPRKSADAPEKITSKKKTDSAQQNQDTSEEKDSMRLFPRRGATLSDISEENDGGSLSSWRSAGSREKGEPRRLFPNLRKSSSSVADDNEGGSVSSRRSAGSKESGERRLFSLVKKSSSSVADDNDGGSVSSRRSVGSKETGERRLFSLVRKSSSLAPEDNDGGSVSSRRSVASKDSGEPRRLFPGAKLSPSANDGGSMERSATAVDSQQLLVASVRKPSSFSARGGEGVSSPRSFPTSNNEISPMQQIPVSTDNNEGVQHVKVVEGILRNKSVVPPSLPQAHTKPSSAVQGRARLSWKAPAESREECKLEVDRQSTPRGNIHQRRSSFLSKVKERKLMRTLSWPPKRNKKTNVADSDSKKDENVAARDEAPPDAEPEQNQSTKPAPSTQDESKPLEESVAELAQTQVVLESNVTNEILLRTGAISPDFAAMQVESHDSTIEGPYDECIYLGKTQAINPQSEARVFWRFQAPDVEDREIEPPANICGLNGLRLAPLKALTLTETSKSSSPSKVPFPHFQNLARNLVYFADALDLFAPFDNETVDDSETLTTGDDGSLGSDLGDDASLDGDDVSPFGYGQTNNRPLLLPSSDGMSETNQDISSQKNGIERQQDVHERQLSGNNRSHDYDVPQKGLAPLPPSLDFLSYSGENDESDYPSGDSQDRQLLLGEEEDRVVTEIRLTFQPVPEPQMIETLPKASELALVQPQRRVRTTPTAAHIALHPRPDEASNDELDDQLVQAYVLSIEECSLYDEPSAKAANVPLSSQSENSSFWSDDELPSDAKGNFKSVATESSDLWSFRSDDKESSDTPTTLQSTRQLSPNQGERWTKSVFDSATTESSDVWSLRSDEQPANYDDSDPFQPPVTNDYASRNLWPIEENDRRSLTPKPVEWQWSELDDGLWQWPSQEEFCQRENVTNDEADHDEHEYLGDIYEFVADAVSSDEFDFIAASSSVCSRLTVDLTATEESDELLEAISRGTKRRSSASQAFFRKIACRSPKSHHALIAYRRQELVPDSLSKIACCTYKPQNTSLLASDHSRSEDMPVNFPAVRFVSESDSSGRQTPNKIANVITVSDFMDGTPENPLSGPQMLYTYEYSSKQHMDVVYDQYGPKALDLLRVRTHRRPPSLSYGSNEALIQVEVSTSYDVKMHQQATMLKKNRFHNTGFNDFFN
jgi:hypothetical protein